MRMSAWAWFSPRARVPQGAPCIFGSIQQTRTAAYALDIPYWSQGRLQRRFWSVGRPRWDKWAYFAPYQTTKCHRAPRCYPTAAAPAGLALLNTPFFARPRRGYIRTRKNIPAFLCNLQWKVCKTPRDGIADVQIKCAGQQRPHPTLKSSRAGTLIAGPHRYTNAARAPSQNRLSEPRLTVRHDY